MAEPMLKGKVDDAWTAQDGLSGWAPAKVNLHLHVTGRRDDGYHLIDSLVAFVGVFDRVKIERSVELNLSADGPFAGALDVAPSDNLVIKAARALRHWAMDTGLPALPGATLRLTKSLPVAAGIGGGSSDAALALRLLTRFWGVPIDPPTLGRLALGLGADLPACLSGQPVHMTGIGEILTPFALPDGGWVTLVNPRRPLATPAVFGARTGPFSSPAALRQWPDIGTMAEDLRRLGNDLEAPAKGLVPEISAILDRLKADPRCLLARMSGSGATCFGLFDTEPAARDMANRLAEETHWWTETGALLTRVPPIEGWDGNRGTGTAAP